jgi:hypothetical protein
MSWVEQKKRFQQQFDFINQRKRGDIIRRINSAIQQNDNQSKDIGIKQLQTLASDYAQLHKNIIKWIKDNSDYTSLTPKLIENGELQQEIKELEKINNSLKTDVESALARDELLRTRETDINSHTLFLLNRPIRKERIPYLWLFSVLLVGVALYLLNSLYPQVGINDLYNTFLYRMSYISTYVSITVILYFLGASVVTIIIFYALYANGLFGKKMS